MKSKFVLEKKVTLNKALDAKCVHLNVTMSKTVFTWFCLSQNVPSIMLF